MEAHDTTTPSVRLFICLLDTIGKVFDKVTASRRDEAIATAKKVPSKAVRIPERIVDAGRDLHNHKHD
ncbi:GM11043 [Drosophila sechellia]|uniref:GM11043 n=1 Tax=Drosophila sechellia TaxID=7238 RepID=B4IPK3_DROSE|nr:GM11043 [Drosophila sechellia]